MNKGKRIATKYGMNIPAWNLRMLLKPKTSSREYKLLMDSAFDILNVELGIGIVIIIDTALQRRNNHENQG
jgi:hypothetical protein